MFGFALLSGKLVVLATISDRSFPMTQMNPLCRRMIDDMTIRNLSPFHPGRIRFRCQETREILQPLTR